MSKIFTRTFRVRWGELDPSGTVSPANYLRYLIETAWDFGDSLGLGANASQDLDLFWLIRDTEIRFLRPLRQGRHNLDRVHVFREDAEHGRLIAGSGADLEHAVIRVDIQRLCHERHNIGL